MPIVVLCLMIASVQVAYAADNDAPKADETAIRTLMVARSEAWGKRDVEGVLKDYADDADYVNSKGEHSVGKKAIGAMYQKLFDSPRSQGATSKQSVTRVKFVGGDVAVVDGAWSSTGGKDEAGKPLPDRQGASVMVLVKESGKWKIATLRSVGVPAAPAAK